nr:solute carrier family 23 protein [Halobacterium zhouii]
MEPDSEESGIVEYGIEDRPPMGESIVLGFQHYLTMIGATVAIPLALAGLMGMPEWATARLISTFFVVSGIATLAQTTIGNRYPIVQGGTFSMLAPAIAIIGVLASSGAGWETMILELQGAVIVAGLVEVLIGYVGLFGYLKRYVGPIVIAPVIALIGLSLFNVGQITSPTQNWWLLGLTVLSILAFSQYLNNYSRVFRLYPVLLGLGGAWIVAALLSVNLPIIGQVYASGTPGYVALGGLLQAPYIQPVAPFQWGMPQFSLSFIIGMTAGMLASAIESFGDYHSVARMAGKGAPNAQRVNHGIGMEGLGNAFAGIMGTGNGSTSYTENVGAIGITGVASRYVVQIGAIVMIVVGYVAVFGRLFATIPAPLVGGLYIAMFGQIAAVGLSNLKFIDMDANRNVYIVGLSLFAGLAIPAYFGGMDAGTFSAGLANAWLIGPALETFNIAQSVGQVVYVIGSTGMAVGGIIAFVLDNTIPGTREERGLNEWEDMTEDDGEFQTVFERMNDSDDAPARAD